MLELQKQLDRTTVELTASRQERDTVVEALARSKAARDRVEAECDVLAEQLRDCKVRRAAVVGGGGGGGVCCGSATLLMLVFVSHQDELLQAHATFEKQLDGANNAASSDHNQVRASSQANAVAHRMRAVH